ncbi:MAG: GAF domain-containing protein [Anaerolineae bacterium]|nr:GAF domain-containing protein [Anaerolineae bacterium]
MDVAYRQRKVGPPSEDVVPAAIGDLREWREELARGMLIALLAIGGFVVAAGSYYAFLSGQSWLIPIYVGFYAVVVVMVLWRRAPYVLRAGFLVSAAYGLAVLEFFEDGRGGSGRVFLVIVPFLAALFFGRRVGIVALAVSIATMIVVGAAFSVGVVTILPQHESGSSDPAAWLSNTLVSLMVGLLVVVSLNYLLPRLVAALSQSRMLLQVTEAQRAGLEEVVAARTQGLRAVSDVARATTAVLDPDLLLPQVVDLVRDRFGLYYVGLFLVDDERAYAVLRAGTGTAGAQMLAQGHCLEVGGESMVGRCAFTGVADVQLDVGQAPVRFDNPLLPDTRSELALPLLARERVIGVLSVQSDQEAAFDETDVALLQTMADQVAVAIDNARLFAENQAALRDLQTAQRRYTGTAWGRFLHETQYKGYDTSAEHLTLPDGAIAAEIREAVQRGQATVLPEPGSTSEPRKSRAGSAVVAPILVRGQVIGVLGLHDPVGDRTWNEDEIALVETVVERVGAVAENLRLLDEAQRRETDARAVRDIADRMRRAPDMDALIRVTLQETASAIGVSDAFLQLRTREEDV